jgi:twitching motility protein PilT
MPAAKTKPAARSAGGLGEVLVAKKVITAKQLTEAQKHQKDTGRGLAPSIVELGFASEEKIIAAVAEQQGVRFVDLAAEEPDPAAAQLIDGTTARKHAAVPVGFQGDRLLLAMADPRNADALNEVAIMTGLLVEPAYATRRSVLAAIDRVYGREPVAPAGAAAAGAPASDEGEFTIGEDKIQRVGQRLGVGDEELPLDINELLEEVLERGASDLHLTAGIPPTIRLHGDLEPLEGYPILKPMALQKIIYSILTQKQRERLENDLELDLSYSVPGKARFRVNVYVQRGALGAAMRLIPFQIRTLEENGIPPHVSEFARLPRGLIVVTGPTGSGKSTTLASIVDLVNRERPVHIMTVEDPIEFLHNHKRSIINQREVGEDTKGFAQALRHVLRQDPDVILVGEMRDLETIQMAITAAETGHLVFGTLHTQDAPQTIDRIIDVFPPYQQQQVRVQLAGTLQAVVAQQLLQTVDGKGRVPSVEILVATPAVRNLIREAKTHQIYSIMQAGAQFGMLTMDAHLAGLVRQGTVTHQAALERCHHADEFTRLTGGSGVPAAAGTRRARVVG